MNDETIAARMARAAAQLRTGASDSAPVLCCLPARPTRWIFTVRRDEAGLIESVVAEPAVPQ